MRRQMLEKLNGGPVPDVKFFHMDDINIAGRKVRGAAPRHGRRAGPRNLGTIRGGRGNPRRRSSMRARSSACVPVGARAYATNTLESGWIPSPLPAVYTGEKMKAYREWLPAEGYEGGGSIGGSFYSENIEDYYLTPYELGYGST